MSRRILRLVFLVVILTVWTIAKRQGLAPSSSGSGSAASPSHPAAASAGPASRTWGRIDTLPDHFARHGQDFAARDADDYAAQAALFLQRARATGLPAKRDPDGSLRVYDPATGAFGAYNTNGTTRTYFKPGNPDYFDRQPGERVDLRTTR